MRKNRQAYTASVLLLSLLTLVIALIVKDETEPNKVYAEPSAMSSQIQMVNSGSLMSVIVPIPVTPVLLPTSQEAESQENVTAPEEGTVSSQPQAPSKVKKTFPTPKTYQVAVHSINVRKWPSPKSEVLSVAPWGKELKVTKVMYNNWLKLEDGSYVNGKYTTYLSKLQSKPVKETPKPKATQPKKSTKVPVTPKKTPSSNVKTKGIGYNVPASTGVNSSSNLTVHEVDQILKGTKLAQPGLAEAIIEVESKYGINAFFTIAVAKLESGNGKSRLAQNKNNLFGLNATGRNPYSNANYYSSKADSVRDFGRIIHTHYFGNGITSLAAINRKYCPPNPNWKHLVNDIAGGDKRKL